MNHQARKYDAGWLGDLRKEPRWKEGLLATVCLGDVEWPALTGDLSLGGVRLAVHGAAPGIGEPVGVTIAFEDHVIEMWGFVQHVREKPWGSVVGVEFEETPQTLIARRYLARHR
jgi:hypothetical protein